MGAETQGLIAVIAVIVGVILTAMLAVMAWAFRQILGGIVAQQAATSADVKQLKDDSVTTRIALATLQDRLNVPRTPDLTNGHAT